VRADVAQSVEPAVDVQHADRAAVDVDHPPLAGGKLLRLAYYAANLHIRPFHDGSI
jgi:hypothetical protein